MKRWKIALLVFLAIVAAGVVFIMLVSHGDEQVSGVALTDTAVSDFKTLDAISSGKGRDKAGFGGALYATSCVEFGKYVFTDIAPVPAGKPLFANVLFIASQKGTQYRAVLKSGENTLKQETKEITSDTHREAVSYTLDGTLLQAGEYTLEIYYMDKRIYSQSFKAG
jgi:hypothetical protein